MKIIFRILINTFAVLLASYLVPGIFVTNITVAILVALVLGIINLTIKPILFVLTLPITIITLGLFALVLNALLFWFAALLVPGFTVDGFVSALLGSLIVSLFGLLSHRMVK